MKNSENLLGVDPIDIPSTVDFPLQTILKYYPLRTLQLPTGEFVIEGRGHFWDMGFGGGRKSAELRQAGFTVGGYDINNLAVMSARLDGDFFGRLGTVTEFGGGEYVMWDMTWLEQVPGLLFQAVFPSLLGDSWKDTLDVADMLLSPGGYIFIADFLRADRIYPELLEKDSSLSHKAWQESVERWTERYETNMQAFGDLGINYGTFFVAKEGPRKAEIDWSDDPQLLRYLYDQREAVFGGFERFACHIDPNEFLDYIVNILGYTLESEELVPRRSRATTTDNPWTKAPGVEWVIRKPPVFKYDTWRYGLRIDDPELYEKRERRKGSPHRKGCWEDYFANLLKHVRPSQRPIFEELARKLGVPV